MISGCAATSAPHAWESRLRGDAIVLLGEVHDNAEHHRQRLAVLRSAFAAGWRPAIAMEQFDRERQADIERARREKPRDAQHVIDVAAPAPGANRRGWQWDDYRPFVALALEHEVPLIAANLSTTDANKVMRENYAAVFDAEQLRALGLDRPLPPALQAAQEREIDNGHCNALPAKALPAMARGQLARDALMADSISRHAARGVVLLAGNGHVRRDIGAPYWLSDALRARTIAVGYLEHGGAAAPDAAFDAVVRVAPAQRADPCIDFRQRVKRP